MRGRKGEKREREKKREGEREGKRVRNIYVRNINWLPLNWLPSLTCPKWGLNPQTTLVGVSALSGN